MTTTLPRTGARPDLTSPATRGFLLFDAALTAVNGLAYVTLPRLLGDLFRIDSGLLIELGTFLVAVGLAVGYMATRRPIPRLGIRLLAGLNLGWVAASVFFAVSARLTTVGVAWVLLQAALVLGFAVRQLQLARRA